MTAQFARAPHAGRPATPAGAAPNAALLIDFDNVTMGIRSDLSKELKTLLNSDIIKGKVAVQRAYADWRRYPQYIVPLSEASVDLIFAPAYGSSKKNATDIRMAIDALELIFIRPEIGTYILLTGDSDFSALVLKLKEYGKYVIGVGMKESRSDILVQNCDEYFSYSALTGLTRAGEEAPPPSEDPWALVQKAVEKMAARNDVMRSDRLKQVMLELDPNFDEKGLGYSKFNRFISEAAKRDRLRLERQGNGQYEVAPVGRRGAADAEGGDRKPDAGGRSRRGGRRSAADRAEAERETRDMAPAYDLLRRAVAHLIDKDGGDAARDSDIKRRMLEIEPDWDERDFGLSKFSHFLRKAHNAEVVNLRKGGNGIYEVALPDSQPANAAAAESEDDGARDRGGRSRRGGLRSRRRGRRSDEDAPPLLAGQTVTSGAATSSEAGETADPAASPAARRDGGAADGKAFAAELGLPTSAGPLVRYVVNSYKGVGKKTAEALIDAVGAENLFATLEHRGDRVREVLGDGRRAAALLDAWRADRERRRAKRDDPERTDRTADASNDGPADPDRSDPAWPASVELEDAVSADAVSDDAVSDDAASEDAVSEDATPEDAAPERSAVPEAPAGASAGASAAASDDAGEGEDDEDDGRRRRSRLGLRRGSRGRRRRTPAGGG